MFKRRPFLRKQKIDSDRLLKFQQQVLVGLDGTRPRQQIVAGQPIVPTGDFPQNIKTYYWLHHDRTESYALVELTTGHWLYLIKKVDEPAVIYLAPDWYGLLKFTLDGKAYDHYLSDTLNSHVD